MKNLSSIYGAFLAIVLVILLLPILILAVPVIAIVLIFDWIIDKLKLIRKLKENNSKIFFLYSDYNNYDFSSFFENNTLGVVCFKINRRIQNDVFVDHLLSGCTKKCFPQLVMVKEGKLKKKLHYDSFKFYVKKQNDFNGFLEILEKSIQNLQYETRDIK